MTYKKPSETRSSAHASSARSKKEKRSHRRLKPWVPYAGIGLICAIIALVIIIIVSGTSRSSDPGKNSDSNAGQTQSASQASDRTHPSDDTNQDETTSPVIPEVVTSITVGSTGDILIHPSVLAAFDMGDGHDFNGAFTYVAPYYSGLDLMIANLEVPLVDPEDGYAYSSNPFASPDAVAEALKNAGVDVCLTANNHTYDMGSYGLTRTQRVLSDLGINYTGTRLDPADSYILTQDVSGIRLGMICYTYETGGGADYPKSLNYIPIDEENAQLVNTFDYSDLETFYSDVSRQLAQMDNMGCALKIFYLHWGDEYQDHPNDYQTEIAQKLCDLGVDVIIGGHPHVVQEFDVLESPGGHRMLCLYSMGNELSNQRRDYMNEDDFRGYTEDGVIFILNIDKYNTGDVKISGVDVIPTWVQRDDSFEIIPLDPDKDSWDWPVSDHYYGVESYNRTIGRLGEAFTAYRAGQGQPDIPTELE